MSDFPTHEYRLTKMEVVMAELARLTTDHEKRLRKLEVTFGYGTGAVGMTLFLLKVFRVI